MNTQFKRAHKRKTSAFKVDKMQVNDERQQDRFQTALVGEQYF